ncbi:hypothetical protein GUJ93_ZPchr0458g22451 [Zizania palustris]|uniref:Uncharacterized protein n=1 Tax=Zizania palustris TaxID=103762 RepID=A0A8J5V2H0_ZIZPA|nr:hypothetical protein GUJ93_ZPchr0458g22451 [Zizania palustris]
MNKSPRVQGSSRISVVPKATTPTSPAPLHRSNQGSAAEPAPPRPLAAAATAAMYSGIGLKTARGSGTNGHVQTNKFFVKPRPSTAGGTPKPPVPGFDGGATELGGMRNPNKEILEHDRKRRVELRLLVLRDALLISHMN